MIADAGIRPAAQLAWAGLSIGGWVASFALAFFLVATAKTLGLLPTDPAGLRVDLGIVIAMHGAFAVGAVQVAAWLALGAWPEVTLRRLAIPAVGVALAVLAELALHEWAEARYGYYDFELVRWTALLSMALVASAAAAFAVAVAPRRALDAPLLALGLAGVGVLLIVLGNVGGLADGVAPGSWPLALVVGTSAAYVVAAFAIGVRHLVDG